jgi:hypothetical protein
MTKTAPSLQTSNIERERWEADFKLRLRELELKERDQRRWFTPLVIAIFAAAIAAMGNAAVAYINGYLQRGLEDRKAEGQLILESLKTGGDAEKATKNLELLVRAGLVTQHKEQLANYLANLKPQDRPALGVGLCALPALGGSNEENDLKIYRDCVNAANKTIRQNQ